MSDTRTADPVTFLRMTGRCANGFERDGGRLVHAVRGGGWAPALCGATPGRKGNGWSDHKQEFATCPRCLKKLGELKLPPKETYEQRLCLLSNTFK